MRGDIMKNAIKTFIFIGLILMCSTLYAQVFERLPDNFTEKYSSSEDYHKEQKEQVAQMVKELDQMLKELDQMSSLLGAFHDNDLTSFFNRHKSTVERINKIDSDDTYEVFQLVLLSSEPYEEGYILAIECLIEKETNVVLEDDIYVYSLDVENKKCELLKCCGLGDEYFNNLIENTEVIEQEVIY